MHLRGVRYLHLNCSDSITDEVFDHFQTFDGLKGIHTLNMSECRNITDKAFECLRGIHTLDMTGCTQITDKGFENLRGIHELDMDRCLNSGIAAAKRVLGSISRVVGNDSSE